MNEQTAKLIQDLAAKLGTTAEHLWGVLVRQAPLSAAIDLIQLVVIWVIAFGLLKRAAVAWKKSETEDNEVEVGAYSLFAGLAVVAGIAVFLACPHGIVSGFFNPEYWALKQILK